MRAPQNLLDPWTKVEPISVRVRPHSCRNWIVLPPPFAGSKSVLGRAVFGVVKMNSEAGYIDISKGPIGSYGGASVIRGEALTSHDQESRHEQGAGSTDSQRLYRDYGKRIFDISISLLILPVFLPVILILAVLVGLDGGNPIFSHQRVGRGGRRFSCLKIRTMATDADRRLAEILATDPLAAEEWAQSHKLLNDPRITPIGRFLRKTSLDELPQLWNVIRGDMSLVGPRPVVPGELDRYGVHVRSYLGTRPGVTGAWQASGRNNVSYDERVQLDVNYVRDIRLLLDVSIILRTVRAVLGSTGY